VQDVRKETYQPSTSARSLSSSALVSLVSWKQMMSAQQGTVSRLVQSDPPAGPVSTGLRDLPA